MDTKYKIGDLILRHRQDRVGNEKKFNPKYDGPYRIDKFYADERSMLVSPVDFVEGVEFDGVDKKLKINVENVRLFYRPNDGVYGEIFDRIYRGVPVKKVDEGEPPDLEVHPPQAPVAIPPPPSTAPSTPSRPPVRVHARASRRARAPIAPIRAMTPTPVREALDEGNVPVTDDEEDDSESEASIAPDTPKVIKTGDMKGMPAKGVPPPPKTPAPGELRRSRRPRNRPATYAEFDGQGRRW